MSGKRSKQIRKATKAAVGLAIDEIWAAFIDLPFRKRILVAWRIIIGRATWKA